MANKHVIFDRHAFTDERVTLNLAVLADPCSLLDLDERPYLRIVSNLAAIEVYEIRYLDILAKFYIRGDLAGSNTRFLFPLSKISGSNRLNN